MIDDTQWIEKVLESAPPDGYSMDEIQTILKVQGVERSLRSINAALCSMGFSRVAHKKIKLKKGKATKYRLKRGESE